MVFYAFSMQCFAEQSFRSITTGLSYRDLTYIYRYKITLLKKKKRINKTLNTQWHSFPIRRKISGVYEK